MQDAGSNLEIWISKIPVGSANGNLTAITRRGGQRITQNFDNLNRLIARNYPTAADNLSFAYDLTGRRTEARFADGRQVVRHTWDAAGRLTATTANQRTVSHQLDPAGNRIRTTWPDGFYVTRQFDAANRLTAIKENGSLTLASFTLDALNRRTAASFANTTASSYAYTPQGSLASLNHNLAGTSNDITWNYTRNQLGEITQHTWTNDKYEWKAANASIDYRSNGQNQYTQIGTAKIQHDANGNLTADGTWAYTFDADNRLKTANKTGTAASLDYDPEGRLQKTTIAGTATELLYDGTELIAEYDARGNLLRRYIHGPGADEPIVWYEGKGVANKQWLYADHLGSIIATTDTKGQSTSTLSYGPFGEPNQSTGVRFRYTGQQFLGPLNLYYYKARVYSPQLGRFLQTDPIGHKDDLNLYAYVGNNPVNRFDPTGLASDTRGWGEDEPIQLACGPACTVPLGRIPPPLIPPSRRSEEELERLWGPSPTPKNDVSRFFDTLVDAFRDLPIFAKPPENAYDPDGPKAPGKPGPETGFRDPKGGENWVPNPNPGRGAGSHGWQDSKGDVWVPSGQGGRAHGGPHWDVQTPGGDYRNVKPNLP
jgi:RHS repeat-associated protein